jgi:hypothetical protein
VPVSTSQTSAVSERPSPDELRGELTQALVDVDAGTLQAVLDALQNAKG